MQISHCHTSTHCILLLFSVFVYNDGMMAWRPPKLVVQPNKEMLTGLW
jgi:hypothetical protein